MRIRIVAVLSAFLLLTAGCGGGADTGSGSGSGGMSLKITEPAAGAPVTTPFTVRVEASVPLGTTESGEHHIHVWFDDKANDYQVVEADHVDVMSGALSPGQHVIHASLRNANHSEAGADTEVTVTVAGAGGPAASPSAPATPQPDESGYGY